MASWRVYQLALWSKKNSTRLYAAVHGGQKRGNTTNIRIRRGGVGNG
nr:MAG TPA: hypothetical protein [Caudoviricetes sp.]DAV83292.1 MAG TPA: hypothetical protein [Caudoviricetes sp.]